MVSDTIKIIKGDYYLIEGLEFTVANHAITEVITHMIGTLDKERGMAKLLFGSGLNSHRALMPTSISKLVINYTDDDIDNQLIKQNLYNDSFSSYSIPSILFELGFVLILFFLILMFSVKRISNLNLCCSFLFLSMGFVVNFNDAIIFYLMLLFFMKNEKKN